MNAYLSYKYFLIANIDNQQYIPKEIFHYIMSIVYDFTYKKPFVGFNTTIIKTNKGLYQYGHSILGRHVSEIDTIDYTSIKKISYGQCFILILYENGDVYMCGSFESSNSKLTYIINNINDISSSECYCAYITKDGDLYIQGVGIPESRFIDNQLDYISDPIKTNITNVKQVLCSEVELVILYRDHKVFSIDQFSKFPDTKNIAAGFNHLLALTCDNHVFACGLNNYYQICPLEEGLGTVITNIDINNVKMIDCCFGSTFILTNDGKVYACGDNKFGQLGIGSQNNDENRFRRSVKKQLTKVNLPLIDSIHCGSNHVIAITIDGEVYGWGYNNHEQLGLSKSRYDLPVKMIL